MITNNLLGSNEYTGSNTDPYDGHGKIWEIAKRHNKKQKKLTKKLVKSCERVGLL